MRQRHLLLTLFHLVHRRVGGHQRAVGIDILRVDFNYADAGARIVNLAGAEAVLALNLPIQTVFQSLYLVGIALVLQAIAERGE